MTFSLCYILAALVAILFPLVLVLVLVDQIHVEEIGQRPSEIVVDLTLSLVSCDKNCVDVDNSYRCFLKMSAEQQS